MTLGIRSRRSFFGLAKIGNTHVVGFCPNVRGGTWTFGLEWSTGDQVSWWSKMPSLFWRGLRIPPLSWTHPEQIRPSKIGEVWRVVSMLDLRGPAKWIGKRGLSWYRIGNLLVFDPTRTNEQTAKAQSGFPSQS